MNNSILTTSAHWPTRWPRDSFKAGPTALLILAVLAAGSAVLVAGAFVLRAQIMTTGRVPIVPAVMLQLILEAIVVAIVLTALPGIAKFSLREIGFTRIEPWQIGVAILGAIAMVTVVEGGASLVETLTHTKHEQSVVEMFKHIRTPWIIWFFALFAIVLAPIAEETIFRIFIFNLGMRYGGFRLGAIVSGICFGFAHWDAFVFIPLALGGVILCYVYYRTRNAFASMITHALFNSVTIVALLYAPQLAK